MFQFQDKNKDDTISYTGDFQPLGNLDPKLYGGIKYDLSYKNVHFSLFMQGRVQTGFSYLYTIYNVAPPGTPMANQPVQVLNRWQRPGDKATFQLFSTGKNEAADQASLNMMQSDARFANASYLRCRSICIAVDAPHKWLVGSLLKNATVYVQAANAFTITCYKVMDPETQTLYSLPPLKTFAAGLRFLL